LPNDISEKNLEDLRHLSLPNDIPNEDLESLRQIFGISKKDLSLRQIFDISDKDLEGKNKNSFDKNIVFVRIEKNYL
jgi:hypothetical protein